jgi:hypothetical protein
MRQEMSYKPTAAQDIVSPQAACGPMAAPSSTAPYRAL